MAKRRGIIVCRDYGDAFFQTAAISANLFSAVVLYIWPIAVKRDMFPVILERRRYKVLSPPFLYFIIVT